LCQTDAPPRDRGTSSRVRTNGRYVASRGPRIFPPHKYLLPSSGQTYPLQFHLFCLSLLRLSIVESVFPSQNHVLASQARGVRRLLAARQGCCRGCSPSRPSCSPVAPRAGARPTLLSWLSRRCLPSAVPPLGHWRRCLRWGTGKLHALPPTPHRRQAPQRQASIHPSNKVKAHAASVCFKCFRCFRDILQKYIEMLHMLQ